MILIDSFKIILGILVIMFASIFTIVVFGMAIAKEAINTINSKGDKFNE